MRTFEKIYQFKAHGCLFDILWREGVCLLKTKTLDGKYHLEDIDLFIELCDGSPNYKLSVEKAIEEAPRIVEEKINELREKEIRIKAYLEKRDYWITLVKIFGMVFPYNKNNWKLFSIQNMKLSRDLFSIKEVVKVPVAHENQVIGYVYVFFEKGFLKEIYSSLIGAEWQSEKACNTALKLVHSLVSLYQIIETIYPKVEETVILSKNELQALRKNKRRFEKFFAARLEWGEILAKTTKINNDILYDLFLIAKEQDKKWPFAKHNLINCLIAMEDNLLCYLLDIDRKKMGSLENYPKFREIEKVFYTITKLFTAKTIAEKPSDFFIKVQFKKIWGDYQNLQKQSAFKKNRKYPLKNIDLFIKLCGGSPKDKLCAENAIVNERREKEIHRKAYLEKRDYWITLLKIFGMVFPYDKDNWKLFRIQDMKLSGDLFSRKEVVKVPISHKNLVIGYVYVFFEAGLKDSYSSLIGADWQSKEACNTSLALVHPLFSLYRSIETNYPEVEKAVILSQNELQALITNKKKFETFFAARFEWNFIAKTTEKNNKIPNDSILFDLFFLLAEKKTKKCPPASPIKCLIAMEDNLLCYLLDIDRKKMGSFENYPKFREIEKVFDAITKLFTARKIAEKPSDFFIKAQFKKIWDNYQQHLKD